VLKQVVRILTTRLSRVKANEIQRTSFDCLFDYAFDPLLLCGLAMKPLLYGPLSYWNIGFYVPTFNWKTVVQ
jgi:hypothetical protein